MLRREGKGQQIFITRISHLLSKRNNINNNSNNNYNNKNFLLNPQRSFIGILSFFYLLFGYFTAIFGLLLRGQPVLSSIVNQMINGYLGKRLNLKAQSFLKEKGMLLNSPWYIPKYFHATATSKIKFFSRRTECCPILYDISYIFIRLYTSRRFLSS